MQFWYFVWKTNVTYILFHVVQSEQGYTVCRVLLPSLFLIRKVTTWKMGKKVFFNFAADRTFVHPDS